MDAAELIRDADRAIARRDFARATALLEEAAAMMPGDLALWMRVAAMRRGSGHLEQALEAVHKALAINPREFMALLMRASLLEKLGDSDAGEAWGHALAQRPESGLPAQLRVVVAEGEQRYAEWQDRQDSRMRAVMTDAEARASEDERSRMARFRSNTLRRTRPFHSNPTDYFYPGLRELEFHPRSCFPWIETMERSAAEITEELRAVLSAERSELVPYVQYDDHVPMDQWRPLNRNLDWTAIHLLSQGERVEANARLCPKTMALLGGLPQPGIAGASPNAMFSLLAPGTTIPPHVGVNNARLVCHLPLIVPEGCWFRVGAETRFWRTGEMLVFDDTIEHEASNPSDDLRVVLIFDIWHPDLSSAEREAVAALIGSVGLRRGAL